MLPRHATSFHKLKKLACVLKERTAIEPIFVLATPQMREMNKELIRGGIEFVLVEPAGLDVNRSIADAVLSRLPDDFPDRHDRLGNLLPISLIFFEKTRRELRRAYHRFHQLLQELKPVAVLVPGDRELIPVPAFLKAARDCGIPSIIAFSGVPDPKSVATLRVGKSQFSLSPLVFPPLLNFVVMYLFPRQVLASKFGKMLFSPGWRTLAHASVGMLSRTPWVQGGGLSDFVFYQDQRRMQVAMGLGVERSKCVLTGEVELDEVHAAYTRKDECRAQIIEKYRIGSNGPMLLVSVPNDAEHNFCGWETHLSRISEIAQLLQEADCSMLFSLHPKSDIENYRGALEGYGQIIQEPLSQILPAFDLYVCALSSTAQWAVACDVPVINIDMYGASDPDFIRPGIVTVTSISEIAPALKYLLNDQSFIEQKNRYSEVLRREMLFDGRSGYRIAEMLEALPLADDQDVLKPEFCA